MPPARNSPWAAMPWERRLTESGRSAVLRPESVRNCRSLVRFFEPPQLVYYRRPIETNTV